MGFTLGYVLVRFLKNLDFIAPFTKHQFSFVVQVIIVILFGLIFFILTRPAFKLVKTFVNVIEKEMQTRPVADLIWGTIGFVLGILIAYLLSLPIYRLNIPFVSGLLSLIVYIVLGYLGIRLVTKKRGELTQAIKDVNFSNISIGKNSGKNKINIRSKVLDTSVIIDGRIADVEKIGFLEGPLIVPTFVLEELQHIADSSDGLKRNRGRRGLDALKRMQEEGTAEIIISEETYDDIPEVDSKIMKMAKDLKGVIVTTDYNLNKVATVQGISVLNINDLANAVKPVVIPGEEMQVAIVKEGNQANQGLAYLDDGTMIVVENGRDLIGQTIDCIVTSVLQTSAGKMIFAKPKEFE